MTVQLNHTIVWCSDREKSAAFLTGLLGLPPARPFGPFLVVDLANGVSLDYYQVEEGEDKPQLQHYAFLISDAEFDQVFARITERGLQYWADPHRGQPGRINRYYGGRGLYFEDPDGHFLEIMTRPYGTEGAEMP